MLLMRGLSSKIALKEPNAFELIDDAFDAMQTHDLDKHSEDASGQCIRLGLAFLTTL